MVKGMRKDFGSELARMLPTVLRAVTSRQESVFVKGKITVPQVVILDILLERGACMMGDLSKTLNFTMSAATSIVDKMVRFGYVKRERCTEDRRIVRVSLLKKGENMAKKIRRERKNITNELFSALTEGEKREYLNLIRKVYNSLLKEGK